MIRLHPQADKLQKDIQDLRDELQQRQLQNEEEMGRLRQAVRQIDDLHRQLDLAELEQDQLSSERKMAEAEAQDEQHGELAISQERRLLFAKLQSEEEEHSAQLEKLALAESESCELWMELQSAAARSTDLDTRLESLNTSLEDLGSKAIEAQKARGRLRGSWQEAVDLAAVERTQVEAVKGQILEHRTHGANAELRAAELCHEAVATEVAASNLWQDIAKVEGQEQRRDELTEALQQCQAQQEELRAQIWDQEQCDSELLASLSESEEHRANVSQALYADGLRYEELKASIRETHDMASRLYARLSVHRAGRGLVTSRHSEMEEAGLRRLRDFHQERQRHADEGSVLQSRAAELEEETGRLEKELLDARQRKQKLLADLAAKEAEHEAQLVRKAELNAELEELKKKWRCVIS